MPGSAALDPRVELVFDGEDNAAWSAALDDPEVEVLWSNYPPPNLDRVPRLRWLAMASAGVDTVTALDPWRLGLTVTNGSGLHVVPMGEYVLAAALFASERIEARLAGQAAHSWPSRRRARPAQRASAARPDGGHHRLRQRRSRGGAAAGRVRGARPGAQGGPVAARRPWLARAWHGRSRGHHPGAHRGSRVARRHRVRGGPGGPDTACDAAHAGHHRRGRPGRDATRRLAHQCRSWRARGRGRPRRGRCAAGRIGGAVLDVVSQEPLPPDHPLWDAAQLPRHAACLGHRRPARRCGTPRPCFFAENLQRYLRGEELLNRTSGAAGY